MKNESPPSAVEDNNVSVPHGDVDDPVLESLASSEDRTRGNDEEAQQPSKTLLSEENIVLVPEQHYANDEDIHEGSNDESLSEKVDEEIAAVVTSPSSAPDAELNEEQPQEESSGVTKEVHVESTEKKWYCRPRYLGVFVLCGCILIAVIITLAVLLTRPNTAAEQIACDFIKQPSLTKCRQTTTFFTVNMPPGTTIPTELGLLTQLTQLQLYYNLYAGTIPSEIGLLTLLTELSFWQSGLSGTIPSSLGNLLQLSYLDFSESKFTGSVPSELGNLVMLNELYFTSNPLSGSIPASIASLTNLEYLSFNETSLTGSIPSSVCSHIISLLIDCGEIECSCCMAYATDDDYFGNLTCS